MHTAPSVAYQRLRVRAHLPVAFHADPAVFEAGGRLDRLDDLNRVDDELCAVIKGSNCQIGERMNALLTNLVTEGSIWLKKSETETLASRVPSISKM